MSVTIYWASLEKNWQQQKKPELVLPKFFQGNTETTEKNVAQINQCPAIVEELKTTYEIHSLFDYEFNVIGNTVKSNMYDQAFFDKYITIRSSKHKLFSFMQQLIFFTEEDDLDASINKFPFLEQNNITERCVLIPGRYNIGKWFRPIEFSFFMKNNFNSFKVGVDEVLYYVQFHTNKKINLVQFMFNEKLDEYARSCFTLKDYNRFYKLQNYYKMFKHKKFILKEIKNNIV